MIQRVIVHSSQHRHLAHLSAYYDNPIVFITTCTRNRRSLLACEAVHEILREIWSRSAEHDGWWIGDYIVLPDHVHFFARSAIDSRPLADWMQMWKSVSARRIAKVLAKRAPIWQPDYFDRFLRTGESYSEKWEYVAQNAVRAGFVERKEDWPYRGVIHDLRF